MRGSESGGTRLGGRVRAIRFHFNFYVSHLGVTVRGTFSGCARARSCVGRRANRGLTSPRFVFSRVLARIGSNDPRAIRFPRGVPVACAARFRGVHTCAFKLVRVRVPEMCMGARADHTVNHTARTSSVPLEVIETTEDTASGRLRFAYS